MKGSILILLASTATAQLTTSLQGAGGECKVPLTFYECKEAAEHADRYFFTGEYWYDVPGCTVYNGNYWWNYYYYSTGTCTNTNKCVCNNPQETLHCELSDNWTPKDVCSAPCKYCDDEGKNCDEVGTRTEFKKILQQPTNGGNACKKNERTVTCGPQKCPVVDENLRSEGKCPIPLTLHADVCKHLSIKEGRQWGGVVKWDAPSGCVQYQGTMYFNLAVNNHDCNTHVQCMCQQQPDVDCKVSDWGEYGKCSEVCGGGVQSRTRTVLQEKIGKGAKCPSQMTETRKCNENIKCPKYLKQTEGMQCPDEHDLSPEECNFKAQMDKVTFSRGTYPNRPSGCYYDGSGYFFNHKKNTGVPCTEENLCICEDLALDVDCRMSDWQVTKECPYCGEGKKSEERFMVWPNTKGGKKCGEETQNVECDYKPCPVFDKKFQGTCDSNNAFRLNRTECLHYAQENSVDTTWFDYYEQSSDYPAGCFEELYYGVVYVYYNSLETSKGDFF